MIIYMFIYIHRYNERKSKIGLVNLRELQEAEEVKKILQNEKY
jgi:hypothetical protein